jgi:hypothetical protein
VSKRTLTVAPDDDDDGEDGSATFEVSVVDGAVTIGDDEWEFIFDGDDWDAICAFVRRERGEP